MNPKYIVQADSGNPKVLLSNEDGTYTTLTHGAGEKTVEDLIELTRLANTQADRERRAEDNL